MGKTNIQPMTPRKPSVTKTHAKAVDVTATVMPHGNAAKSMQMNTAGSGGGKRANVVTNLGGGRSSAPRGTRQTIATGKH